MTIYLVSFSVAFILSFLLVPAVGSLGRRWGVMDRPGPRKVHVIPVPRLGGLAIYVSAMLTFGLLLGGAVRSQVFGILGGATLVSLVGFLDDAGKADYRLKLFLALPLAGIILILSGIHVALFSIPLLDDGLTLLWVIGVVSAFNLIDNMDGLCAGLVSIASFFFLALSVLNNQYLVAVLACAILGSALGFLVHNFHPANIFMGDGGTMFFGFMMAALGIKISFLQAPNHVTWVAPILVLAVPLFDTSLVTISRLRRRQVPFKSPGKDHLSHRLMALGLSQRQVAYVHYALGIASGLAALFVSRLSDQSASLVLALLVFIGILAIVWLEKPFKISALK